MRKTLSLFLCLCLFMSLWGATSADAASDKAFSDNPQAIQDASESVVMLNCYDEADKLYCTGSAFAAFAPGVFITNYHVIEDGIYSIKAQLESGMEFRITDVVGYDKVNDVAILYTDVKTGIKELPVGDSSSMLKGEKVTTIGSPLGLVNTVSVGLFSGPIKDGDILLLQFSAPISHGSSGGALFNDKGEVVGVTSSSLTDGQNLNFAIPIETVAELWKNSDLSSRMTLEEFSLKQVKTDGADSARYYCYDGAGLLSEDEWIAVESKLRDISKEYGVGIYIVTLDNYKDLSKSGNIDTFAEQYYKFNIIDKRDDSTGMMLLMSMNEGDYTLKAYGADAQYAFTDFGSYVVAESFLDDFRKSDWFAGFLDYANMCEVLLEYADNGTPIDVDFTGDLDLAA